MNNIDNLSSYDGVESTQLNMFNKEDLELYLKDKLESAKSNLSFIKTHIYKGKPLSVCEIGSGNSKLLYLMDSDGLLGGVLDMRYLKVGIN